MIAVESARIPVLSRGEYRYERADAFALTPMVNMYTLGREFLPERMHSGGLRYHGKSPLLSLLFHRSIVEATMANTGDAFKAGRLFYETEGILPGAGDLARDCSRDCRGNKTPEQGREQNDTILFVRHWLSRSCWICRSVSVGVIQARSGMPRGWIVGDKLFGDAMASVLSALNLAAPSIGDGFNIPIRYNNLVHGEVVGNHGFWGAILKVWVLRYLSLRPLLHLHSSNAPTFGMVHEGSLLTALPSTLPR